MPRILALATARALALLGVLASGCIPYTVGSTAQTVPEGQTITAESFYIIPNVVYGSDTLPAPLRGVDFETRHGITDHSDIGFRVSGAGLIASYKERLGYDSDPKRAAVAVMTSAGWVNSGQQLYGDFTLIASGREDARLTPYGGIRGMAYAAIARSNIRDYPHAGAFVGARVGDRTFMMSPEVGVFYDRRNFGTQRNRIMIVPGLTIQRGRRDQ